MASSLSNRRWRSERDLSVHAEALAAIAHWRAGSFPKRLPALLDGQGSGYSSVCQHPVIKLQEG
jgi:hypothetical protein